MRFSEQRYLAGVKRFIAVIPQCQALKMDALAANNEKVLFTVPFADHLIGKLHFENEHEIGYHCD